MTRGGFSLLELSVVLTIIAIVLASGLTLGGAKIEQNQIQNTFDEMEEIDKGLSVFVNTQGRMPCPSPLVATRADAEFGREATTCDATTTGIFRAEYPAGSGNFVVIGGVPFYALDMPDEYMADDWNVRYTYAVSESFITAATPTSTGNLRVEDDAGTLINDQVAWVLISHGPSRRGGYVARTGATAGACNAANADGENCDNDDGLFVDGVFNDGDVVADFFDDIMRWETRMQLFNVGVF